MPFIIAEPCIATCDTSCIPVCPVDCIHGPIPLDEIQAKRESGDPKQLEGIQLFIDPDKCIDCGACEPECPVEAIFEEDDTPDKWKEYVQMNYDFFGA